MAALLVDLDIVNSRSRPYVSDHNPFSEAQFKTLQYRPDSPARFGGLEDARALLSILRLVQNRPSPLRHRLHDAGQRPLWLCRCDVRHAPDRS